MSIQVSSVDATEVFVTRAKKLVDDSGIKEPPIDPARLAIVQGVRRIMVSNTMEVSGELVRDGGELVIRLNGRESPQRRNFSCCHEIAHTFAFHSPLAEMSVRMRTISCLRYSPQEQMCDRAAAEMLMPEKFFRPVAANLRPGIESLATLSRVFGSSIGATMIRLGQLRVWPVVFIVWKFTTRLGSSRKLRVFWSARPAGSRCFIPRHAPARPASGMYATFSTSVPTFESESLDLGSLRGSYLIENARFGEHVVSIVHDPKLRRGA